MFAVYGFGFIVQGSGVRSACVCRFALPGNSLKIDQGAPIANT